MGRERVGFRPVDLARMVGISTQQIRNYVDAGVLPPTPRSPTGYRRFDERHRAALLTYRALAKGYGWDTAKIIMRAVHDADPALALTIVDASHAALHEQRLALRAAGEALEAVASEAVTTEGTTGGDTIDAGPGGRTGGGGAGSGPGGRTGGGGAVGGGAGRDARIGLRIGEVAAVLGVRASALRVWETAGLLAPRRAPGTRYRAYGPTDIRDARMINILRQGRYPFAQIRPILTGLRETGSSDALREAIARRGRELTRRAAAMLEGSSHLHHYLTTGQPSGGLMLTIQETPN